MKEVIKEKQELLYADVILPLAVAQHYTYRIPDEFKESVEVGKRVEVQFGAKRSYAGLVKRTYKQIPPDYPIKPITTVLDDFPILFEQQLELWDWLAGYYRCSLGEIMIAGLPSAMKLSSETKVLLNPLFDQDFSLLGDEEFLVAEALNIEGELDLDAIKKIIDKQNITYLVKSLLDKGVIILQEELKESYKPKMENFIALAPAYEEEATHQALFQMVSKAPSQERALLAFFTLAHQRKSVSQPALTKKANVTGSVVKAMMDKGIFTRKKEAVDRIVDNYKSENLVWELSPSQNQALWEIGETLKEKRVALLYGVTASGKTQVYIELIKDAIADGKNVLYLLPEIALSAQMIARLRKVFGSDVGIYHSKFNPQERVEIWQKVLTNQYKVVVGVRSSLFLPLQNLGLIVIDEEHDPSYKQQDPAPRYNARDVAIKLAVMHNAKVIMGSATPALESFHNALNGKFGLIEMPQRFGGIQAPEIELVDIKQERKEKRMRGLFSQTLLDAISDALKKEEQIILFRNRRGHSTSVTCQSCGWIPQCIQCDVTLTYHKYSQDIKCHYCGYTSKMPPSCPQCKSPALKLMGFGTEKVMDDLNNFFPDHQIARMDLETTRQKSGYMKIINAFEEKTIDVLVGTQMVTKGLDFDNVGLVGILSADSLMGFPDFRSTERGFQLMLQVSGRTGRRQKRGKVLIQTNKPGHPVFDYIQREDYKGFYQKEIQEREQWVYPPFARMAGITLKHKNKELINHVSFIFTQELSKVLPGQVLGPSVPSVSMVRNYYIRQVLLKMPNDGRKIRHAKKQLDLLVERFRQVKEYRSMVIQVDVDPY